MHFVQQFNSVCSSDVKWRHWKHLVKWRQTASNNFGKMIKGMASPAVGHIRSIQTTKVLSLLYVFKYHMHEIVWDILTEATSPNML